MAEIYLNLDNETKKAFKVKCAMDGVTQVGAVQKLVKLYIDGNVFVKDTSNP